LAALEIRLDDVFLKYAMGIEVRGVECDGVREVRQSGSEGIVWNIAHKLDAIPEEQRWIQTGFHVFTV